jgi:hypothetical protein
MNVKPAITMTCSENTPVRSPIGVVATASPRDVVVVWGVVKTLLVFEVTISVTRVLDAVVTATVSVMLESFTVRRNSAQSITKSLPCSNNGSLVFSYT